MAVLGIVYKVFFIGRLKVLSLLVYLVMGWLAIVAIKPLVTALAPVGVALVAAVFCLHHNACDMRQVDGQP